jgi:predicted PurR-regulated permease PerM
MAIGAMIPFVGTAAVWLPWAVALALVGRWGAALALVATGVLVIGTLDNILRPVLVGGRTGMHSLVVFFAVLGGLQLFGVFGLIIGPALFAVVGSLLEQFRAATLPREDSPVGDSALSPP